MRIGILTYHNSNNYGAVLQAYALQKYLNNIGVEAEIIDYHPNKKISVISNNKAKKVLRYMFNLNVKIQQRIRQQKFDKFRNNYIKISSNTFYGDTEIVKMPPVYDIYIAGSDQIWNTDISNNSKAYFLHFVKTGRKISYAASLGKDSFNDTEKDYIKKYLKSFDSISVRETMLQLKLKDKFSINSSHVLDPVFLLDKNSWIEIANRVRVPQKYVLCYMMEYSQELINHTKNVAEIINCIPIFISPSHTNFKGKKLNGICPSEFIYLFANARYVCTNSFHGTAFSLVFKKDFTIVKHSRLNSRIESLLSIADLNDRYLDVKSDKIRSINYKLVDEKIAPFIKASKQFLIDNIFRYEN